MWLHEEQLLESNENASTHDFERRPLSRRMRRGIVWAAIGVLVLGGLAMIAADRLIEHGPLSIWSWTLPLSCGVLLTGVGFGVIIDEAARANRAEVDADRDFLEGAETGGDTLETDRRRE